MRVKTASFCRGSKNETLIFRALRYLAPVQVLFAFILMLGPAMAAAGPPPVTIRNALKLLPEDQAENIVRIEAREGNPAPERWYVLTYDAAVENGLREFVVSGNEIAVSRSLSQFLQSAAPEDVVGGALVKVDSDELANLVLQYGEANHLPVVKINYTMLREAGNPEPVWKLSCLDESGKKIAGLVVNAGNGSVVSHDGFAALPAAGVKSSPSPRAQPTAKAANPARRRTAVKASPSSSAAAKPREGLFQRLFDGKSKKQPVQNQ